MEIYKGKWKKKPLHLLPGIWPNSLVTTKEAATILNCSVRTLERYRMHSIGPTPEPIEQYIGTGRLYFLWKIIIWKSQITGSGPITTKQVWEWFIKQPMAITPPRPNPSERPDWWPRGERFDIAKSRELWRIKLEVFELGVKLHLMGIMSLNDTSS